MVKVAWLAACIAVRVVGAVFVIYLRHWRTICLFLQQSKGRYLRSEDMSQTLLTNRKQGNLD